MFHRAEIEARISFPNGVQKDTLDKVHTALDGFFLRVTKSVENEVEGVDGIVFLVMGVVPSGINENLIFDSLVSQLPDAKVTQVVLGINRKLDENNQVVGKPGYYFHPLKTDGLFEMNDVERFSMWRDEYGMDMMVMPNPVMNKFEYADMMCNIENMNIPTHRSFKPKPVEGDWVIKVPSTKELLEASKPIEELEARPLVFKKEGQ